MVVLDIETSGLNPNEHGLLSIGAVDLMRPKEIFYIECRLRRGETYDKNALYVNGFDKQNIKDPAKPRPREAIDQFDRWLKQRSVKVIAGLHVAAFDVPFLNAKAEQTRSALRLHRRSVDLHSIAYAKMLSLKKLVPLTDGWSVMDVDSIYPFCGLPLEPTPHNALNGAKWEAECFYRLIYSKGLYAQFKNYSVPKYLAN